MSKSFVDFLVEDKLQEVFAFLNPIEKEGVLFPPYFGYGDEKDLNLFLSSVSKEKIYPLIWYLYPSTEIQKRESIEIDRAIFILSVIGNLTYLNKDRIQGNYSNYLNPVLQDMKRIFEKARNFEIMSDSLEVSKYPNYGDKKLPAIEKWDSLKIVVSLRINKFCHGLVTNTV